MLKIRIASRPLRQPSCAYASVPTVCGTIDAAQRATIDTTPALAGLALIIRLIDRKNLPLVACECGGQAF